MRVAQRPAEPLDVEYELAVEAVANPQVLAGLTNGFAPELRAEGQAALQQQLGHENHADGGGKHQCRDQVERPAASHQEHPQAGKGKRQ
ncbi:hypothetical protein D9M68_875140 [compost metagenome]